MNKRGMDYIDWTLSIGIFIVAVIALFAFLKPGLKPEYEADNLINIVETNLLNNITWKVKSTPLFITNLQAVYGPAAQPVTIHITLTGPWKFKTILPLMSDMSYSISNTAVNINCLAPVCQNKLLNIVYTPNAPGFSSLSLSCNVNNTAACDSELGATEEYYGIRQSYLNNLQNLDYEDVKESWNYPEQKEFVIYKDNHKILGPDPASESSVFVKELKLMIVEDPDNRVPVTLSIRVW